MMLIAWLSRHIFGESVLIHPKRMFSQRHSGHEFGFSEHTIFMKIIELTNALNYELIQALK